jgi:hypothetical protein
MIKHILIFLYFSSIILAQNSKISGIVYNDDNNEPIPYVNIRIEGTTQGTSANSEGNFILDMPKDKKKLIFTAVGFRKKVIKLNSTDNKNIRIGMQQESIQLLEIVIGVEEDPAYRIIREAIKRKEANKSGLKSLEFDFFSKDIFLSSGKVAMVSEKFSTGYYETGKQEKIITKSLHITENERNNALNMKMNILNRMYIDFSKDTLEIIGNKVFLPLAYNAFEFYDYHLKEVKQSGSFHDCFIEVIPRSKIQPLLKGIIVIEDSSYSLKNIHLFSNAGIRFPYINDLNIEFVQNCDRFRDYWLPVYLKVVSGLKVNFGGLIGTNDISMNQVTMFTNYKLNLSIPDSIYHTFSILKPDSNFVKKPNDKNTYLKTAVLSRTQIDSLRPIPLTKEELNAYKELDSTQTIGTQIKFSGLLGGMATQAVKKESGNSSLGKIFDYTDKILSILYLRDNKVDGIVLGGKYKNSIFDNVINTNSALGFALGRQEIEWKTALDVNIKYGIVSSINFEFHDEARELQTFNPYPDLLSSINVLLGFSDYYNYYRSQYGSFGFTNKIIWDNLFSIKYVYEEEKSLSSFKYQSIFNSNRIVNLNPAIMEGKDNRISFNLSLGRDPQSLHEKVYDGIIAQFDLSKPVLGSNFNYEKIRFITQFSFNTFYGELFSAPYLLIGLEGGAVFGNYAIQHLITPNTALNIYSPFLTFKGLSPYEYAGNKFIAFHTEHNWRTIPFQSVGLTFLADYSIDVITGFSILNIWNETPYFKINSNEQSYWEVYIGFGRILGLGRIDFSYGANQNYRVRVALSSIL